MGQTKGKSYTAPVVFVKVLQCFLFNDNVVLVATPLRMKTVEWILISLTKAVEIRIAYFSWYEILTSRVRSLTLHFDDEHQVIWRIRIEPLVVYLIPYGVFIASVAMVYPGITKAYQGQ